MVTFQVLDAAGTLPNPLLLRDRTWFDPCVDKSTLARTLSFVAVHVISRTVSISRLCPIATASGAINLKVWI